VRVLPESGPSDATAAALAALVLGDGTRWLERGEPDSGAFLAAARAHGVLALVAERAADAALPGAWTAALADEVRRDAAIDLVRERELRALIEAFAAAGLAPLLLKGAHLAYAIYPRPDLRPRVDTDLLIEPEDRARADQALRALGYRNVPQIDADLVMYQRPYEKRLGDRTLHMVDLHWRMSNAQRFGTTLSVAEIRDEARPVPRLHPGAIGPSPVHALLLACVHRVAHHLDASRVVWSYDIQLLCDRFTTPEWERFVDVAAERRVAAACARGLSSAVALFGGTAVPAGVRERLERAAASEVSIDAYLGPGKPHIARILSDLRGAGSWRRAVRMTRQHVLPSARYMREVYAPSSHAPLPLLYVRRAWRGARRWMGRA
jgi:hypothetical protein